MTSGPTGARTTLSEIAQRARAGVAGGRAGARRVRHHGGEMLAPFLAVARGARQQLGWASAWWKSAPPDRRKGALVVLAGFGILVYFLPIVIFVAVGLFLLVSAWQGRDRTPPPPPGPDPSMVRLQTVYNALVPYLRDEHDPAQRFRPGGSPREAFEHVEFDGDQLRRLEVQYSPFFTDDEPESRRRIERVIEAKTGRAREYLFAWDTERNHLTVAALPSLPPPVPAQPYVTAPREIVLGFTDTTSTHRNIPVDILDGTSCQLPPVIWRAGPRSTAPHLLAAAPAGAGKSTFLRTVALQALRDGEVLAVDGTGAGDFACLARRRGVLRVETGHRGAVEALTWLRHEAERRITAISRAKTHGCPVPAEARRPLLVLLDEITELSGAAAAEGRPDPQELLEVPLRLGRSAHIHVVATVRPDQMHRLHPALLSEARARVALGPLDAGALEQALGVAPGISGGGVMPPGRGYARIGSGPAVRIQTPHTPDPLEEDTSDTDRRRVLRLLPRLDDSGPAAPVAAAAAALAPLAPGEAVRAAMSLTKTGSARTTGAAEPSSTVASATSG